MKVSRRQLGIALVSAGALASQGGQAQPPPPTLSPEAELAAARDQVKAIAMALLQQQIPMSTEPAFAFQA